MTITNRLQELRSGFSSTFWIANTLELFERLAFYGSKAVLVVFLTDKVGLVKEAGTLTGIFSGVIYSLPIVAGVFVDKYGFRKTLMTCFLIFSIGYFLIGMAGMQYGQEIAAIIGTKTYVLSALLFTAVGGSLIKPCIVGTVAFTSKADSRAFGFSIYYTLVNLGGAIGPILAMTVRKDWGIEYVLVMSSFTSLLMLVSTFLFFKEPVPIEGDVAPARTFGKVFSDMLLVFGNFRFIAFLVIFSGFWIMFWQIFFLLPKYTTDVLDFHDFELLETVDAFCIILLTIPITALVKRFKPITAMTMGFVIASLSWFILGSFISVTMTVVAIAFYALGEAIQSPRFYEYVSKLAPPGQVGTFMGFAFLPVAIGSFTAGVVSDYLRLTYMTTNPSMMWYIVGGIGIVSTVLMILYNMFLAPKQID
jgi:proton-dependent oligopeptide transporter, POT family